MERQFRKHFAEAGKRAGLTGENMLQILEMRLDNVVFRLGFADSRRQARQIVCHGHISLNGRKTDIPSCIVKVDDVIAWQERSTRTKYYEIMIDQIPGKIVPEWLSLDNDKLSGRVMAFPNRNEIDHKIDEKVIVEYYSR
jgi:small subunit ribosomal protein S4